MAKKSFFKMLCGILAGSMLAGAAHFPAHAAPDCCWRQEGGAKYWYENGVKQGTEGRGKEIYDPDSDAWYWLDAIDGGKMATGKDVYQESAAGAYADKADGTGKWVRYDKNGHMVKGWDTNGNGTYYFDLIYGTMVKGWYVQDGRQYYFDPALGTMAKGNVTVDGVTYHFDENSGVCEGEAKEPPAALEKNTLTAVVGGENMTFYLESAKLETFDGSRDFHLKFYSFTDAGAPRYQFYIRLPYAAQLAAGTYSKDWNRACYFELDSYNPDTGKWPMLYRMVHYGSSTEDMGTFTLTLDRDLTSQNYTEEMSGSLEVKLIEYDGKFGADAGKSPTLKTLNVTNAKFNYTLNQTHPAVQAWKNSNGITDSSGSGSSSGGTSSGIGPSGSTSSVCLSCHGSGLCKFCNGTGKRYNSKTHKYYDCGVCYGNNGKCVGCRGTGTVR